MKVIASYKGNDPNDTRTTIFENVSAVVESPNGFIVVHKDQTRGFLFNAFCDKGIEIEREDK